MKTAQIRTLLPFVFQDAAEPGSVLASILDVMEAMHERPEWLLDHLDGFFDPYRTPDNFMPFLAGWVDLDSILDGTESRITAQQPSLSTGVGRLRELTAAATNLSRWRGTLKGLRLFLETATGMDGFLIEENPPGEDRVPRPFHVRITAPPPATSAKVLVQRIVELEKPAYVTYDLIFSLTA